MITPIGKMIGNAVAKKDINALGTTTLISTFANLSCGTPYAFNVSTKEPFTSFFEVRCVPSTLVISRDWSSTEIVFISPAWTIRTTSENPIAIGRLL